MYLPVRRAGAGRAGAAAVACAAAIAASATVAAQQRTPELVVGGARAASGVHALAAGFSPDPFEVAVHPQGTLHVPPMQLGPGCRGWVSAEPDAIVRLSGAIAFVRLFARSRSNVTLVVRDPSGRWYCNDDVMPGRDTNPMVDVYQPRPGQYDVWVGGPANGERADGTLHVTSQRTQRP
jgi:hypothetical protein